MSTLLNKILRERKHRADTALLPPDGRRTSRTDVRLAFLYQYETGTDVAPLLRFELLGAYWFRRIWERYLCVLGSHSLPDALRSAVGCRIQPGFPRLPENLRHELYKTHLRYVTRMLQAADPAPVALAELIAGASILPSEYLREGDWYVVEYLTRGRLRAPRQPVGEGEMVHATIGLSTDRDGPPRRSSVLRIVPLAVEDPALHVLLQALHFPQTNPQAGPESRPAASGTPRIHMHMRSRLGVRTGDGEVPVTFLREAGEPPLPPRLLTELLGASAHGRPRTKVGAPSHAGSYIGGAQFATAAPSGSPQQLPVNPMACMPGDPQPFVGINMVGAGNNTALHGRNGILAFVDFGAPAPPNADTVPPGVADPCICGDPLMILSHWDYDHYAMARKADGAWRCRRIAPQQIMGTQSAAIAACLAAGWGMPAGACRPCQPHLLSTG